MRYAQALNSGLSGLMQSIYAGRAGKASGQEDAYKQMMAESQIGSNEASAGKAMAESQRLADQREYALGDVMRQKFAEQINSPDPVQRSIALQGLTYLTPNVEQYASAQDKVWDRGDIERATTNPDFRLNLNGAQAAQKGNLFDSVGDTGYVLNQGTGGQNVGNQDLVSMFRDKVNSEIGRNNRPPATGGRGGSGSGIEFTPEAIDAAANRYNYDGTMPTLGMGPTAVAARAAILNRAASLNGENPSVDLRSEQVVNKANAAALAQLQKQQTMISAFEKNAMLNAGIALKESAAVDRIGVPLFNKWLMAGQKATGDVDVVRFNAANETFVNEYAKIMSGSMGNTPVSDSARAHAHEMLSIAKTQEQYAGTINLLKQEMKNRMVGLDEEKRALIASMRKQPVIAQFPATQDAAAQLRRKANKPKAVQWLKGRNIQTQDQFRAAVQSLVDGGWSAAEIQQIQEEAGL